jgi:hypothetical protein
LRRSLAFQGGRFGDLEDQSVGRQLTHPQDPVDDVEVAGITQLQCGHVHVHLQIGGVDPTPLCELRTARGEDVGAQGADQAGGFGDVDDRGRVRKIGALRVVQPDQGLQRDGPMVE